MVNKNLLITPFELTPDLLLKLGLPTLWRDSIPLFSPKDASRLLLFCSEKKIVILGVDGFHIIGNDIVPDFDFTADFSELIELSDSPSIDTITSMSKFIVLMNDEDDVFLEFCLGVL